MRSAVRSLAVLCAAAALPGCTTHAPCPPPSTAVAGASALPDWHDVITDPDHVRLRAWRAAFTSGLAQARKDGHGNEIDALGPLLDPDVALDGATLAQGTYRCRVYKLGTKTGGRPTFLAFPAYQCIVKPSAELERLAQEQGIQRPSGRLYPDTPSRMVFLGTMVLSDETKPIRYGRDADRDLVGSLQRIGDKHWRLLMPQPAWESTMDVMDIVPG